MTCRAGGGPDARFDNAGAWSSAVRGRQEDALTGLTVARSGQTTDPLEVHVARVLVAAPPLTSAQADALRAILRPWPRTGPSTPSAPQVTASADPVLARGVRHRKPPLAPGPTAADAPDRYRRGLR